MITYWHQVQKFHNEYITSCRSTYYVHRLESERNPRKWLSIVHDNMDKMKTSISRLGRKEKSVSTTYNLPVHLTGMITHGHWNGGFGHFRLPFLHTGSNFTVSSLFLCLSKLEDPLVDDFGHFLYEIGSSIHVLLDALLQSKSYDKC